MPQKMRINNQNEYSKFLEKRGNIFHYVSEAIENRYENSLKIQDGNYIYSDKVVILYQFSLLASQIGDIAELFNCRVGKGSNKFTQSKLKESNCIVYFITQNVREC
ncbi:hypothetical protein Wcon_01712 [Wolbachia endosymbiont of Cylisticus convexus]|uniref:hypothetical protein n=1 Tax=Wolbachia endosymbiont of Cylisticus convexus TaxID=118728 RepID=UPI000E18714C|nr:hypothetical protein [Wolbachia endosymbiont of Cylisticus convexus]RDD34241.1 hypothetical protein Wcon_01712 [Wolbachia endosymbiont of Cylisticus convexus]